MALERKIDKEAFEGLNETIQSEYKEVGGEYVLDVAGIEDTGALKRAKDREVQKRRDAESELKELRQRIANIEGDDARKKGDIETLEKSWQKKLEDRESELSQKISTKDNFIKKSLVDNKAMEIASKISTSPQLILPHIKARLTADLESEEGPKTRVLDAEGKVSAMTLEDLSNEFVENKDFSTIIIGSKASGSGASVKKPGSGGAPAPKNLANVDSKTLLAHIKQKKEQE